jgi:hypothetical protein
LSEQPSHRRADAAAATDVAPSPDARTEAAHTTTSQESTMTDTQTLESAATPDGYYAEDFEELPPRPRRKLATPVTLALLGALLTAGGFLGGVLVQKSQQSTSGAGLARALAAGAGGTGSGRAAAVGPAAASSGRTVGQVSTVSGRGAVLYVTTAQGNTVRVQTSSHSTITKSLRVGPASIHPGDTVVVQGIPGAQGSIVASSVSDSGTSGGGLFGALFGGGGRGGGLNGAAAGGGSASGRAGSSAVNSLFGG